MRPRVIFLLMLIFMPFGALPSLHITAVRPLLKFVRALIIRSIILALMLPFVQVVKMILTTVLLQKIVFGYRSLQMPRVVMYKLILQILFLRQTPVRTTNYKLQSSKPRFLATQDLILKLVTVSPTQQPIFR